MDFEGVPSTGPEGAAYGHAYGDHVSPALQSHFRATIATIMAAPQPYADDFMWKHVEPPLLWIGGVGGTAAFEHPANVANKLGTAKDMWGDGVLAVRYLPLSNFLRFFLGVDPIRDLPPITDPPARVIEARRKLQDGLRSLVHPGRPARDLGNPNNGRVWVTAPEGGAPHGQARARGDSEADACTWIARRMGLAGYAEPGERAASIGMVALGYPLGDDVALYRPTILDALVHPLFYPGPKALRYGETLPLTTALRDPDVRATAGEPEWIHRNYRAVLVSGGAAPRTCQLLWYGMW
jgi:hypothetical protein